MRKKLKILFGVILVLVLVVGGFALGVYLRLFDTQALNEKFGLHELPVIGEYFVPPAGQVEKDKSGTPAAANRPHILLHHHSSENKPGMFASPKKRLQNSRKSGRRQRKSALQKLHVSIMR